MRNSITMRNNFIKKLLSTVLVIAFWLFVWEATSLLIGDNLKLFLPSPFAVIAAMLRLAGKGSYWLAVLFTLVRIFIGFLAGVIGGITAGVITGHIKLFDLILSPVMRIIRAVPVVSFIILAYLFINVNYLPLFMSFLMVMPLIWQTTHDELVDFDKNLTEMATVFRIKGVKKLFSVKLVTVSDKIISSMVNGIGFAWKSGVAAEVLCTPAISLGKSIYRAKGDLNYDEVYALTLTVVFLSIIIEYFVKNFCGKKLGTEKTDDKT